jgi:hypothetical protein
MTPQRGQSDQDFMTVDQFQWTPEVLELLKELRVDASLRVSRFLPGAGCFLSACLPNNSGGSDLTRRRLALSSSPPPLLSLSTQVNLQVVAPQHPQVYSCGTAARSLVLSLSNPRHSFSPSAPRASAVQLYLCCTPDSLRSFTQVQVNTNIKSTVTMMRLTLLSAAAISAVHASVSTSVFPNSLCQGASDSLGGLVGVGKVTLANGDVEVHCGCPSVRFVWSSEGTRRVLLTDTSLRACRTTSPTLRRARPRRPESRSATRSTTCRPASSRPRAASSPAPARACLSSFLARPITFLRD